LENTEEAIMNTQDDKRMLAPVEPAPWDEKFADEQVEGAPIGTGEMLRNEDGYTWCSVILEVPVGMPDRNVAAVLRKLAARIEEHARC
jgi:hypothetical protein